MHETGNVLHVGVNYAYRDLDDTAFDSRIRPRLGMRGIATSGGNDAGDNGNRATFGGVSNSPAGSCKGRQRLGPGRRLGDGPFSAQAEYLARS